MLFKKSHRLSQVFLSVLLTLSFAARLGLANVSWNSVTAVFQKSTTTQKKLSFERIQVSETPTAVLKKPREQDFFCILKQLHPVDCFFHLHPEFQDSILWRASSQTTNRISWPDWEESYRDEFRKAYDDYVQWYQGGMVSFPGGGEFADPLPNGLTLADDVSALLNLSEKDAWVVFRSYAAFILTAEIEHWFPWSLAGLEEADLDDVFLSGYYTFLTNNPDSNIQPPGTGYFLREITPAPPTAVMKFLRDNNIIRATQEETVAALLNWMKRLNHISGALGTALNYFYHWGYRGPPPLSRIFVGTQMTDPEFSYPGIRNWIHACFGSTYFMQWVLRIAHIPARQVWVCGHSTVYFPTLKKYLSHADDPYNSYNKSPPDFPKTELLVDIATMKAWFGSDPTQASGVQCNNIGRTPQDLALKHLPDYLLYQYCEDLKDGKSHGEGSVAESFKDVYSVADLEALKLWGKLEQKLQAGGGCAAFSTSY